MRILLLFGCFLLTLSGIAEDWPTFRRDAQRSGISTEAIELPLKMAWQHIPDAPPVQAWTGPKKRNISAGADGLTATLDYDTAFHAIAAGDAVYYGSSATDTVYCLSRDGSERWSYVTEGPVRLAPVFANEKIYFGSDDGYVYCVRADTGKLIWRHLAGPEDRRIPGNGRMISEWPVRGGLVVDGGLVYFSAGLFPSHGVFLGALDVSTGKPSWKQKIKVSPQGYLLTTNDRIFVPTGRTPFQEFTRKDGSNVGKLGRSSSWGKRLHGGSMAVVVDGKLASGPSEDGKIDVFNKAKSILRMEGRQLLVENDIAYLLTTDAVKAVAWKQLGDAVGKRRGEGANAVSWTKELVRARCMVKTANSLFVGGRGWLRALSLKTGEEIWRTEMTGAVESIAVSNGSVYACTDDGRIHSFVQQVKEPLRVTRRFEGPTTHAGNPLATAILAATPIRKGYALVLGVESGETVAELAVKTEFHVVARDPDPEKVRAARAYLRSQGLYGTRAVVHLGTLDNLPYTNFAANVVTSESAQPLCPATELKRMVRPHGGLLYLNLNAKQASEIASSLEGASQAKLKGETALSWLRPGLPGEGVWSHFYGNPANTACSNDTRGTATMRMQWFGQPGPEKMVDRHNKTSSPLYKNGRMIVPGLNYFVAADAYNGTILWEKDVPDSVRIGAMRDSSNMALGDDALFIATADACLKIDPQSGRELHRYSADDMFKEKGSVWGYVATVGNMLYGSSSKPKSTVRNEVRGRDAIWRRDEPLVICSDRIFAVDASQNKLAWSYKPESGVVINPSIAIADGRVHFVQSDNPETRNVARGQIGLRPLLKAASLVALDAKTGAVLWKKSVDLKTITDAIYVSVGSETVVVTGSHYRTVSAEERRGRVKPDQALRCRYDVYAFDTATGAPRWSRVLTPNRDHELKGGHGANIQHPAIVGSTIYGPGFATDLRSGKDFAGWKWEVSHKCGTVSTSAKYAYSRFSKEKFCYVFDLKNGAAKPLSEASRPGCWINILPVGGLVLVPEASAGCTCEYSIQSSMAFLPQ